MAWQFPVSTNTAINLGTTDNLYVAEGMLVGTQSNAVSGSGTAHIIEIYGTVISAIEGIVLSGSTVVNTNSVYIGENGHVISKYPGGPGAGGIVLSGGGGSIVNDGEIQSTGYGVYIPTFGVATATTVTNHGLIDAGCGIAARGDSAAVVKLFNDGTILGTEKSYGQTATQEAGSPTFTKDLITNKGLMVGDITLRGGDDVYNGISGVVKGTVYGDEGADKIYGGAEKNTFEGGAGEDTLRGGKGGDKLTGGADADTFVFKSTAESTVAAKGRDAILDFKVAENDIIDLHYIDADTKSGSDQLFHFIGGQDFHHKAGELRFEKSGGNTHILGDVNGDGNADFAIDLKGSVNLHATDFAL
jgi:Ca2+-binding RTX toxin-like protein